jgi:hypothetical protein
LNSAIVKGEWSASRPGRFTPGKGPPGTHWIGGWLNPRAGMDDVEKRTLLPYLDSNSDPTPGRPVRSQSLYRLRYPGFAPSGNNRNKDRYIETLDSTIATLLDKLMHAS